MRRVSGVILFDEGQQRGPLVAVFLAKLSSCMVTGLVMLINFILNIVSNLSLHLRINCDRLFFTCNCIISRISLCFWTQLVFGWCLVAERFSSFDGP